MNLTNINIKSRSLPRSKALDRDHPGVVTSKGSATALPESNAMHLHRCAMSNSQAFLHVLGRVSV